MTTDQTIKVAVIILWVITFSILLFGCPSATQTKEVLRETREAAKEVRAVMKDGVMAIEEIGKEGQATIDAVRGKE